MHIRTSTGRVERPASDRPRTAAGLDFRALRAAFLAAGEGLGRPGSSTGGLFPEAGERSARIHGNPAGETRTREWRMRSENALRHPIDLVLLCLIAVALLRLDGLQTAIGAAESPLAGSEGTAALLFAAFALILVPHWMRDLSSHAGAIRACTVVRKETGRRTQSVRGIAAGDPACLSAGEEAPADLRLAEASGLTPDRHSATGDDAPATMTACSAGPGLSGAAPADVAAAGCGIVSGSAVGAVAAPCGAAPHARPARARISERPSAHPLPGREAADADI